MVVCTVYVGGGTYVREEAVSKEAHITFGF